MSTEQISNLLRKSLGVGKAGNLAKPILRRGSRKVSSKTFVKGNTDGRGRTFALERPRGEFTIRPLVGAPPLTLLPASASAGHLEG